jgi:hypothetical protein
MAAKKPERLLLTVAKGTLVPADGYTVARLRARGFNLGDEVHAVLTKSRNPKFHRLVHSFGQVLVENIEAFEDLDGHRVLKRLQIEGNIGCDEVALIFPGLGPTSYRVPRSLSFESMDEGEFHETFRQFSRYVSKTYWPTMTPEQIEQMAGFMPDTP